MRLLMLNPNTSQSVTDLIADAARAAAAPGTEIVPMTAPRGVPYIANRAEAVIGGAVALEMLAGAHSTVDAAVIAAFADPALGGAPLAGLAARVADRIAVPAVDCVAASVKQAEALVALRPRKAARGSYRRPDAKDSTGLDPALADWVAHRPRA